MSEEEKNESTEATDTAADEASDAPAEEATAEATDAAAEEATDAATEEATDQAADGGDAPAEAEATEDTAAAPESADASAAPKPAADPEEQLSPKERRRLRRSRQKGPARPARGGPERDAERLAERQRKAKARRKRRADAAGVEKAAGIGTPPAEHEANQPKMRQGVVVSNKAEKTITVRIDVARRHPVYEKIVRNSRNLHAHDERGEASEGDVVRVIETRPMSKSKRWRLVEVVEKAQ